MNDDRNDGMMHNSSLVGLLLSQGSVMTLIKNGLSEVELGIDTLRNITNRTLGPASQTWFWSSRVRVGIV